MRRLPLVPVCALLLATAAGCATSGGSASGTFSPLTRGVLTLATATVPTPGLWEGTAARPRGGFEFALGRALARRFGLATVRVRIVPFQRIVAGRLGGADLALSLVTPTERRDRVLDFSAPYVEAPPVVLARAGVDAPDLATARGLRWVVVRGSTLEDVVDSAIEPLRPVLRAAATTSIPPLLESHRADAALLDAPLGVVLADRSSGRLHVAAKLSTPEAIAAALPEGSKNREATDSAMRALAANGTLDRLARRWLGSTAAVDGGDVPLLRTERG